MLDKIAQVIENEFGYIREESKRLRNLWMENYNQKGDYTTLKL